MEPQMHAALVTSFDEPPHYRECTAPTAGRDGEVAIDVLAVGLHPRVRSGAGGRHYTSTGELPMIPGVDGVGRRADDGVPVYFICDDAAGGSMCERVVVSERRTVELPADVDVARVAAAMNPAMSSWVALRSKRPLTGGERVLVLGATGSAGTMAVQIAQRLGAASVVGAGRNAERLQALTALGADAVVQLTGDVEATSRALAAAAADVDVVIDYLWGQPAEMTMKAILLARTDRSAPLDWVQIGSLTGPTLELPSAYLRSANLRIQGNGQGSTSPSQYVAQLSSLVEEIDAGGLAVDPRLVPLQEVEAAWSAPDEPGRRTVITVG